VLTSFAAGWIDVVLVLSTFSVVQPLTAKMAASAAIAVKFL
jgi:hypothetical protein